MKRVISLLIVLWTLPLSAAPTSNDQATIELREHVLITAAQVRLADVADIRAADSALQQRLQNVRIAPAPRPGASRKFNAREIEQLVRPVAHGGTAVFAGARAVTVERASNEYDGAALLAIAREYLLAHVRQAHADSTRVEVAAISSLPNFRGPAGSWRAVPRINTGSSTISKRMSVWLDLEVDGEIYRSMPLWFSVNVYRPVVVAKRSFQNKERMALLDLMVEERDVAAFSVAPIAAKEMLVTMRARRAIAAGSVVQASDVEPQPSVLAEQEIDVRVLAGPIAIDTKAVAEEEGDLGELIRVRNPRSTQTYLAQVIGDKKALVKE